MRASPASGRVHVLGTCLGNLRRSEYQTNRHRDYFMGYGKWICIQVDVQPALGDRRNLRSSLHFSKLAQPPGKVYLHALHAGAKERLALGEHDVPAVLAYSSPICEHFHFVELGSHDAIGTPTARRFSRHFPSPKHTTPRYIFGGRNGRRHRVRSYRNLRVCRKSNRRMKGWIKRWVK